MGRNVLKFQTIFVQQVFINSLPFLSYSEKYILGAVPVTPLWGRLLKKMKNAYCLDHHFQQLLLYNAFENILL